MRVSVVVVESVVTVGDDEEDVGDTPIGTGGAGRLGGGANPALVSGFIASVERLEHKRGTVRQERILPNSYTQESNKVLNINTNNSASLQAHDASPEVERARWDGIISLSTRRLCRYGDVIFCRPLDCACAIFAATAELMPTMPCAGVEGTNEMLRFPRFLAAEAALERAEREVADDALLLLEAADGDFPDTLEHMWKSSKPNAHDTICFMSNGI